MLVSTEVAASRSPDQTLFQASCCSLAVGLVASTRPWRTCGSSPKQSRRMRRLQDESDHEDRSSSGIDTRRSRTSEDDARHLANDSHLPRGRQEERPEACELAVLVRLLQVSCGLRGCSAWIVRSRRIDPTDASGARQQGEIDLTSRNGFHSADALIAMIYTFADAGITALTRLSDPTPRGESDMRDCAAWPQGSLHV